MIINISMPHWYVITDHYQIQLRDLEDMTCVVFPEYVMDHALTQSALQHLQQLENLSIDQFDWQYYLEKYPELDRKMTHSDAWTHWTQTGHSRHWNPIDHRTLNQAEQINDVLAMLEILDDARHKPYDYIVIVFARTWTPHMVVPLDVIKASVTRLTIGTSLTPTTVGYCLPRAAYELLLYELTFCLSHPDDLLEACATQCHLQYQCQNVNTSTPVSMVDIDVTNEITIREDPTQLLEWRHQWLAEQFQTFLSDHMGSVWLSQVLHEYPYEQVKTQWNRNLDLTCVNYWLLCASLSTADYFDQLHPVLPSDPTWYGNSIYFDRCFYLQMYPCYNGVFKQYDDAYGHFVHHGIKEKLIPNQAIFQLIRCVQNARTDTLLGTLNLTPPVAQGRPDQDPLIYVLTRTCQRPALFQQNVDSLLSQNYSQIRHVVSYDTAETYEYVKTYPHIAQLVNLISYKHKLHPNQYVDLMYDAILARKEPGWVVVVDDDDKWMTPHALHYLKRYLTDPQRLIIWMLYRADKFIYPIDKNCPAVGEIATCCYLYHTSKIQKGGWGPSAVGDFPCFRRLFARTTEHVYVDLPLTGVNYQTQVSGWTAM